MAPTIHLDPIAAGERITRGEIQWGEAVGSPAGPITFGFRSSRPAYNSPFDEQSSFSRFATDQMAMARTALRLWSNVANITFEEVAYGAYTDAATILFGNFAQQFDGATGFAYTPGIEDHSSASGDVWMNAASVIGEPTFKLKVILHETGHALGLDHPGDYGSAADYDTDAEYVEDSRQYTVMSYFDASETGAVHFVYATTPLLHDIAAIQRLYGANSAFAAGDTVYGFNSDADPAFRISALRGFEWVNGGHHRGFEACGY